MRDFERARMRASGRVHGSGQLHFFHDWVLAFAIDIFDFTVDTVKEWVLKSLFGAYSLLLVQSQQFSQEVHGFLWYSLVQAPGREVNFTLQVVEHNFVMVLGPEWGFAR